ncbi:MAG: hypothetical protein FJ379_10745 [Verrucomicrobia bacterium]|nr:hypothetical protein [Verrucomicrobiota bacterium]
MLAQWAELWRAPQLAEIVAISFSTRLKKSLGRVRPATGVIRLNSRLQNAPGGFLIEVLCHEAAHVAVYLIHGSEPKPHGPEWCALIRRAGYQPTTKLDHQSLPPIPHDPPLISRHRYRCPVCQVDFFVRRKSSRLHCSFCESGRGPQPLRHLPFD